MDTSIIASTRPFNECILLKTCNFPAVSGLFLLRIFYFQSCITAFTVSLRRIPAKPPSKYAA